MGVNKDSKLELQYLTQESMASNFSCCSELAQKYLKGDGVEWDFHKALEIISKADTRDLFDEEKDKIIALIKSQI